MTAASSLDRRNRKLAVSYRSLESLIPYARNARTHSDAQVAQIAASIREFGFTNPILTDGDNGVIAGHGRVLAARKLGMTTVPVIELAGMVELDPAYCDVIVRRWQDGTGKRAIRQDGSGLADADAIPGGSH